MIMGENPSKIEPGDEGRKPEAESGETSMPSLHANPTPIICRSCGTWNLPDSWQCVKCHRFLTQHKQNLTHGLNMDVDRIPPGLDYLQTQVDAFVAGSLVDEGDTDVSTRRRILIGTAADCIGESCNLMPLSKLAASLTRAENCEPTG